MQQGALTSSMSTGTLRTHSHGIRTLNEMGEHACNGQEGLYIQRRHTHCEPDILLAEDVLRTQVPCLSVRIIQVTKYSEDP